MYLRNLLIPDFALFEGPSNHAGLDQAIKQEADLKTRDKLPMIAMTSLEACFPSFAAGRAHFDTPETGDQPVRKLLSKGWRRAITKYEKEKGRASQGAKKTGA
jgi:hypothetical protein